MSGKTADYKTITIGMVVGSLVGMVFAIQAERQPSEESVRTFKHLKIILYILLFMLVFFFVYMSLATTVFLNWPADELLDIWALIAFSSLLVPFIGFILFIYNSLKRNRDV